MFENLLNLVKEHAGDAIVNNPAIPNENNDAAIQQAGSSIAGGLQNLIGSGGLNDIMKMFSGGAGEVANSPVAQAVSGNVIQDLMSKFGLDQQAAGSIAGNLVPSVLQNLVSKTNDPNDSSFDIKGVISSLTGGNAGGMDVQGLLGMLK